MYEIQHLNADGQYVSFFWTNDRATLEMVWDNMQHKAKFRVIVIFKLGNS